LRVSFQANPQAFSDSLINPFPSTVNATYSEIVVDGRPSRKVVGQESPLAATTYDIEDGVEDLAWAMSSRPPMFLTALCNEVGPGELALLKGTLDDVTYLPA
jgi:hypothetical protein